jgi:aryl-alcohol dehydrogenase-like predicted oxidoreductase
MTPDSDFPGFGMRPFGRKKAMVSPIALAGSALGMREPSIDVYRRGLERGFNFFFWDGMFKNMTRALLELSIEERSKLFIVAAIPFGGPKQIRRGLIKRLEILGLEKLSSFHLGWVRSRFRVRQSVLDELISLREEGLCDNIGLSIHQRRLAFEISQKKIFDVFMLRYNAAHRGLEADFLDRLDNDDRPSVMTYTATRWRKLLEKPPGWEEGLPRPGDLYRFALSHPLVDAVCMAPHNMEQLESNLAVVSEGPLKPEEAAFVRRFGDAVYAVKIPVIGNPFEKSAKL